MNFSFSSSDEMDDELIPGPLTVEKQQPIEQELSTPHRFRARTNGAYEPQESESTEIFYRWVNRPPNVDTRVVHHCHWDIAIVAIILGVMGIAACIAMLYMIFGKTTY